MRHSITLVRGNCARHNVAVVHHEDPRASQQREIELHGSPRFMASTLNVSNMTQLMCSRHVLAFKGSMREQYRTFLGRASIFTEYLRNVGDTTLKTSLAVPTQSTPWSSPAVRLEAHRDKSAWFATFMAGTTSVSGTICVIRSWYTGFVVLSLRGPHQLEFSEGRQDRSSTPHRKPSHWWSHRLDFIADGANAVNFLVMRSPIPWNEGASLSKTGCSVWSVVCLHSSDVWHHSAGHPAHC